LARIKAALGTVSLTADQKSQLETVESTLHTQFAPVRAARVALRSAIADQVATGNLNPTALATPLANLAQAAASTKPAVQAAANALYATLTPTQREQLVAAMKQQREAFDGQGHLHAHHARLKKLAAELNLTSDELASIRAAMKAQWAGHTKGELGQQFSGRRQRMQTLALAFTGPAFDAAALDVGSGLATRAEQGPEHKVKMLSVMLPILTADQRQQLAQILRSETPFLADD
jgi:Spy/CpxP family protein refolding chaperone